MTDRPIIFSAPMVRALLEGCKTQTRRLVKLNGRPPEFCGAGGRSGPDWNDPPCWGWEDADQGDWITLKKEPGQRMGWRDWRGAYAPGDRLYVCEDWRTVSSLDRDTPAQMRAMALEAGWRRAWAPIRYEADAARDNWESGDDQGRRRWSRHMIREFSRLTLTVTEVRVQRLQEISGRDMLAEGIRCEGCHAVGTGDYSACRDGGCFALRNDFRDLWNSLHGPAAWGANPWVVAISFTVARCNIDREAS